MHFLAMVAELLRRRDTKHTFVHTVRPAVWVATRIGKDIGTIRVVNDKDIKVFRNEP